MIIVRLPLVAKLSEKNYKIEDNEHTKGKQLNLTVDTH